MSEHNPIATNLNASSHSLETPTLPDSRAWVGSLAMTLLFFWIVPWSFGAQGGAWINQAFNPLLHQPNLIWIYASLGQAALIAGPLIIFARFLRAEWHRAILRAWLLATGFLVVQAPTRLLPAAEPQILALTQLAVSTLYLTAVLWYYGVPRLPGFAPQRVAAAIAAAVFALPWLLTGALGSIGNVVLNAGSAIVFGFIVNAILKLYWMSMRRPAIEYTSGQNPALSVFPHNHFIDGIVAGTVILIMASGMSFNGAQLLLMLALPALAWVATRTGAPAVVLGLGTAAPLLFVDTHTINLQIGDSYLLIAFIAAGSAMLIGGSLGLIMQRWAAQSWPPVLSWLGMLLTWGGVVLIYLYLGTPGLYGDRIFVVLQTQASVAEAATIADYDARRLAVYEILTEHAQHTQAGLVGPLERLGIGHTPFYLVNAIEVDANFLVRMWLNVHPQVDRILPSPRLRPLPRMWTLTTASEVVSTIAPDAAPETPLDIPPWNLALIQAPRVWEELGIDGTGIVIGHSDSGVQFTHPELIHAYRGTGDEHAYHWLDAWNGAVAPVDYSGHGTHTLGTIVGRQVGVAPGAQWFACANLVRNLGNPSLYLTCLQFMFAPYPPGEDAARAGNPHQSAHILNNSWGCPEDVEGCDTDSLRPAVAALRAAGLFVVASAGNEGPRCATLQDPLARYAEVLSVGAIDRQENLATFSSVGPVAGLEGAVIKPDLVAPGVGILSAYPGNDYAVLDGTSMAGPHVAGVVALMWSANPALIGDIGQTEAILRASARPFAGTLGTSLDPAALAELEEQLGEESILAALADPPAAPDACVFQIDPAQHPNHVAGWGIVDAYAAVLMTLDAVDSQQ